MIKKPSKIEEIIKLKKALNLFGKMLSKKTDNNTQTFDDMEGDIEFSLEISVPGKETKVYSIHKVFVIGSELGNLVLKDQNLEHKHAIFRDQNGVLSFQCLGPKGSATIAKQKCEQGKVYLLDNEDQIVLSKDIKIKVIYNPTLNEESDEDITSEGLVVSQSDMKKGEAPKPKKVQEDEVTIARLLITPGMLDDEKVVDKTDPKIPDVKELEEIEDEVPEEEEQEDEIEETKRPIPRPKPRLEVVGKAVKVPLQDPPGILARSFSFFFEIIFLMAIYPFIKDEVQNLSLKISPILTPYFTEIIEALKLVLPAESSYVEFLSRADLVPMAVLWLTLYLIIHLLSGLVFSSSWPLFLLGYTDQGNMLTKRLKFFLRTIFGLITTPLLVFEIPVLFKKRPLKEILSGVKYEKKRRILSFSSKIFLLPLILIVCILLPFVKDLSRLDGLSLVVDQRITNLEGKDVLVPLAVDELFSRIVAPKGISIIPRLNLKNQGPRIQFFDFEDDVGLTLQASDELDSAKLISSFKDNNFFFSQFFPKTSVKLSSLKEGEKFEIMHTTTLKEVAHIISASLQFQILEAPQYLATAGPWVPSYFAFRDQLFKSLNITYTPEFELKFIQNGLYLFVDNFKTEPINTSFIVPIGNPDGRIIELTYKKQEKKLANKIKNALSKSRTEEQVGETNPLDLGAKVSIILFNLKEMEALIPDQENLITSFYLQAAAKSIASDSEKFYRTVVLSLNETLDWLREVASTHEGQNMKESLSKLEIRLREILAATESKDASFFAGSMPVAPEENTQQEEQIEIRPE